MSAPSFPPDDASTHANPYASPQADLPTRSSPVVLSQGPVVDSARSTRQWEAHVRLQVRRLNPPHVIVHDAVAEGLAHAEAEEMVDRHVRSYRNGALWMMAIGIGIALLGVVVTVVSYLDAASKSGHNTYLIWWGPVVVGTLTAIFGLVRLGRIP